MALPQAQPIPVIVSTRALPALVVASALAASCNQTQQTARASAREPRIPIPTDAQNHRTNVVHAQGQFGAGVTIAFLGSGYDSDMNGLGRPHRAYYPNGNLSKPPRLIGRPLFGLGPQTGPATLDGLAEQSIAAGAPWGSIPGAAAGHAPLAGILVYAAHEGMANTTHALETILEERRSGATTFAVFHTGFIVGGPVTSDYARRLDELAGLDVLVTLKAGRRTHPHPSATNALAVGMVSLDTKLLDASSAAGLPADQQRIFPDLVAAGVSIPAAQADNEGAAWRATGTRLAAASVAGAAALYRAQKPSASALETKAAIIATVERLAAQDPTKPLENGYGAGYLRVDRMFAVATGADTTLVRQETLTAERRTRTYSVQVTRGDTYGAAITWFRQDTSQATWSDLALQADNCVGITACDTPRNLVERIEFTAANDAVQLTVSAKSLEAGRKSQEFALVLYGPIRRHRKSRFE